MNPREVLYAGNDKLIAARDTRNGFAIGVVHNARSGVFQVVRLDPSSRYVTISNHATETDARAAANAALIADNGAGCFTTD